MKIVKLGQQGLKVPAVGLGCMGISEFYGQSDEANTGTVKNGDSPIFFNASGFRPKASISILFDSTSPVI
jgi:hypothetical protein